MPKSSNGTHYRTHGQAYRASQTEEPSQDMNNNGEDHQLGKDMKGGGNIVAIKHNDGPPYHVKHEDGEVSKHDSKEDLMAHLDEHIPGGEKDEDDPKESNMDSDYGSEGSREAIESLLG